MKKTIVIVMAIVAMLLTCNMASAANVAIYVWSGANSEYILSLFRAVEATGHTPSGINSYDIENGRLTNFDVLILPAGQAGPSADELNSTIGKEQYPERYNSEFTTVMKTNIRNFVSGGGGFVGIELGAYFASSNYTTGLQLYGGDYWAWADSDPGLNILGLYPFAIDDTGFRGPGGTHTTQDAFMSANGGSFPEDTMPSGTTTTVIVRNTYNSPVAICFTGIWDGSANVGTGHVVLTSLELSLRADDEPNDEPGLLDWTIWDNWVAGVPHSNSVGAWQLLGRMINWAHTGTVSEPTITSSNPSGGQKVAVISTYGSYKYFPPEIWYQSGAYPGLIPAVGKSIEYAGHIPLAIRFADVISGELTFPDFTAVVFPGGHRYGYETGLGTTGANNVETFVRNGGGYLGICAGSFYGATRCVYVNCDDTLLYLDNSLNLVSGLDDTGPIRDIAEFGCPTYEWTLTNIKIEDKYLGFETPLIQKQFYYGGGYKNEPTDVNTVSTYNYDGSGTGAQEGEPDAVRFELDKGRVMLVGTHPEVRSGSDPDGSDPDWLYWDNYEYNSNTPLSNPDNPWEFIDAAFNKWLLPAGKGLAWLRENQVSPGSGSWSSYAAVNALCTLAFLNADFTENNDTMVSSAIANITSFFDSGTGAYGYPNYDNSICILPLVAANSPTNAYNTRIINAKDSLLNFQNVGYPCGSGTSEYTTADVQYGGWGYPGYPGSCDFEKWADLSNTQWTLMGLRFAYEYLPNMPIMENETWANNAFTWVKKVQDVNPNGGADGGFTYTNNPYPSGPLWGTLGFDSYSSMTYAGIWSYALLGKKGSTEMNAALGWVDTNYSIDSNFPAGDFALYYYYLTMAKALAMAEPDPLVFTHNWKEDLIEKLAILQNNDGSWENSNPSELEGNPELCTAYALLALQAFQEIPSSFWLTIGIASPANLVVCDPQGRCCSKDECSIPGASFSGDGHQTVTLNQLESGHYRLEFHATEIGTVYLTINGWRGGEADPIITVEKDFDIEKSEELWEVFDSDLFLSSLVGPLTITVEEPELAFCYPVANAGSDQTVEAEENCETLVTLVGSESTDCDSSTGTNDDIILFEWYDEERTLLGSGMTLDFVFPLGMHTVTLEVTDNQGNTNSDVVSINVVDTTPPEISVSVSPDTLWPPNHKMVPVIATVSVSDNCDEDPDVVLISVVSSEPDDAKGGGDGKTTNDIHVDEDGTIYLRAERQGKGDGRIYTITYEATDASGNSATASATVTVPHNQ